MAEVLEGEAGSLRAHPERDPHHLGDQRQPAIDVTGRARPARHARDQEGQPQRVAEELGAGVHLVQVQLG